MFNPDQPSGLFYVGDGIGQINQVLLILVSVLYLHCPSQLESLYSQIFRQASCDQLNAARTPAFKRLFYEKEIKNPYL